MPPVNIIQAETAATTKATGRSKRSRSVDRTGASSSSVPHDPKAKSKHAKSSSTIPVSPSIRTTELSGATRNMRFMQRGRSNNDAIKTRHSFPQRNNDTTVTTTVTTTGSNIHSTISRSTTGSNSNANDNANEENSSKESDEHQKTKRSIDVTGIPSPAKIKWETATPFDMYGKSVCLLVGRRSYNGFNPTTASNLHMQQQHLDYEEKSKRRTGTTGSTTRDNTTTPNRRRYKELSNEIKNEEKRSSLSLSGGNKKKNEGTISTKKKKTLDDILKLVDS